MQRSRAQFKLLVVAPYYKNAREFGGPASSVPSLCEALARRGVEVTVLTTTARRGRVDDPPGHAAVEGVGVYAYRRSRGILPFTSRDLRRAIELHVPTKDVALLTNLFADGFAPACRACYRKGVPYVVSPRGQLMTWSLRQRALKKKAYLAVIGRRWLSLASSIHCTDEMELQQTRHLGIPVSHWSVPNLPSLPAPDSPRSSRRLLPGDQVVLLFAGRLHEVKRPDIAIRALAAVRRLGWGCELWMAGHDEQGLCKQLLSLARELEVESSVRILGLLEKDELAERMAGAHILLMPSASENFGMMAVEAAARGMVVLASEHVPSAQILARDGAALVCRTTDGRFESELCCLVQDPDRLEELSRRAPASVDRHFSEAAIVDQMLERLLRVQGTERR